MASNPPTAPSSASQLADKTSSRLRPTESSLYDFDGVQSDKDDASSKTWMHARNARDQVADSPGEFGKPYPKEHKVDKNLTIRAGPTSKLAEYPLKPDQKTAWDPKGDKPPGAIRSVYDLNNRTAFEVRCHDPRAGYTANSEAKFVSVPYRPAAEICPSCEGQIGDPQDFYAQCSCTVCRSCGTHSKSENCPNDSCSQGAPGPASEHPDRNEDEQQDL